MFSCILSLSVSRCYQILEAFWKCRCSRQMNGGERNAEWMNLSINTACWSRHCSALTERTSLSLAATAATSEYIARSRNGWKRPNRLAVTSPQTWSSRHKSATVSSTWRRANSSRKWDREICEVKGLLTSNEELHVFNSEMHDLVMKIFAKAKTTRNNFN